MKRILYVAAAVALLFACGTHGVSAQVKNVIMMVGDGMGVAHVTQLIIENELEPINMERAQGVGLMRTFSANNRVTDSAAAGTAFATGTKTNNSNLGIGPDGERLESVLEKAAKQGRATGIVVSTNVTHATPAAFYAHVDNRNDYQKIAAQMLDADIDVVLGGGRADFDNRRDGRNLMKELTGKGYKVVTDMPALNRVKSGKVVGLFSEKGSMPYVVDGRGDFLPRATGKALELLTAESTLRKGGKGFFLMVEGSLIDYAAHANNAKSTVEETRDFDQAVGVAFDYADSHPNTLVVVFADHETGGLTIPSGKADFSLADSGVQYKFSSGSHTASLVPVFAYGEGAEKFSRVLDNTDIPKIILELMGL